LLAEDVTLFSDGGGKVRAARRPIEGRAKVARFLLGILGKGGGDLEIQVAEVNGQPGFVVYEASRPTTVAAFDLRDDSIATIRFVVNPEKLERLGPPPG
jgi:RNA polymerase sigma-70 factor (ECF subfamily)